MAPREVLLGGPPPKVEVVLTQSDLVLDLRAQIAELKRQLDELRQAYNRVEYLHRCETIVNMELVDLCKAYGIRIRPSMFQRP